MNSSLEELTGKVISKINLHGGDINDVYLLQCKNRSYVLKENRHNLKELFAKEASGLGLLKKADIPIPEVYYFDEKYLLLEYLEPGKRDEVEAGCLLAKLHLNIVKKYGLETDNYIGSLPQENKISSDWASFFWSQRIHPLLNRLSIAYENHHHWKLLSEKLPQLLYPGQPRLLHGDLWSGNLYYSNKGPIFIDPAVYYGSPAVELSFTRLFGGFGEKFYDAYREIIPFPDDFPEMTDLYNIYPLLVHAVIFGGGYYSQAERNAKRFV